MTAETNHHQHDWRIARLGGVVHYFWCATCHVVTDEWVGEGPEPEGRWRTLNALGVYRRHPDGTLRKESMERLS